MALDGQAGPGGSPQLRLHAGRGQGAERGQEPFGTRQAKAIGGWHWTVRQDLGAAPNYAFTPDAASTIKPPTGWEAVTDGSEQDETRPWATPAYKDLRHWLGN